MFFCHRKMIMFFSQCHFIDGNQWDMDLLKGAF